MFSLYRIRNRNSCLRKKSLRATKQANVGKGTRRENGGKETCGRGVGGEEGWENNITREREKTDRQRWERMVEGEWGERKVERD